MTLLSQRRQTHFTLIEMLVVITIIVILAGLLLPSLRQASEMAYQSSCVNNQRQVGHGLFSYVNDYSGWSLESRGTWAAYPYDFWGWQMQNLGYLPAVNKKTASTMVCPTLPSYQLYPVGEYQYIRTYSMRGTSTTPSRPTNFLIGSKIRDNGNATYSIPATTYNYSPSGMVWVFDGLTQVATGIFTQFGFANNYSLAAEAHNANPTVLLMDGHVESGVAKYGYFVRAMLADGTYITM